jgi:tRNA pseudouridine55 synthase
MDGLLLIDKPRGVSSFGSLIMVRKSLGIKKIGHAGTLDPLATGLMVVGVGKGTKALAHLVKLDKEYVATIRIGESRTTSDLEGDIVVRKDVVSDIAQEAITTLLDSMVGVLSLPVSPYSAIKVDGVPMYRRARKAEQKGETITEVPVRDMRMYEATLLSITYEVIDGRRVCHIEVRFFVGSGTYIRSLAEELGKRIGYPACLASLRRTRVGNFSIDNAIPPEKATTSSLIPLADLDQYVQKSPNTPCSG